MQNIDLQKSRCSWVNLKNDLYINYHDNEWGVPVFEDNKLFEALSLEISQAGLSWEIILNKRENYRKLFDNFDVIKVAKYSPEKQEILAKNPKIIRNKSKIKAIINNAKIFLEVKKEFGSFSDYFWSFSKNKTISITKNKDSFELFCDLSCKIYKI